MLDGHTWSQKRSCDLLCTADSVHYKKPKTTHHDTTLQWLSIYSLKTYRDIKGRKTLRVKTSDFNVTSIKSWFAGWSLNPSKDFQKEISKIQGASAQERGCIPQQRGVQLKSVFLYCPQVQIPDCKSRVGAEKYGFWKIHWTFDEAGPSEKQTKKNYHKLQNKNWMFFLQVVF